MNTFYTLINQLPNLIFQPTLPGGGTGNPPTTGIDAVPIDNYILIGLVVAVLISLLVIRFYISKTEKN